MSYIETSALAKWCETTYYGFSWFGIKIDLVRLEDKAIETITFLIFFKFGFSWVNVYPLEKWELTNRGRLLN